MRRIGFGRMTPLRNKVLKDVLRDRVVWDVGCGTSAPHLKFLRKTSSHVHLVDSALDRFWQPPPEYNPRRHTVHAACFDELEPIPESDVAFVSWPVPYGGQGLGPLLSKCQTVIYLGQNDDVTSCGPGEMWKELASMEPVQIYELRRDVELPGTRMCSMIIYERKPRTIDLCIEEKDAWARVLVYDEELNLRVSKEEFKWFRSTIEKRLRQGFSSEQALLDALRSTKVDFHFGGGVAGTISPETVTTYEQMAPTVREAQ